MNSAASNERAVTGASPHTLPSLGVVLVAAGRGERLGADRPKAFVELGGRTLIEHCITRICALPHAGHLVVVVPDALAAEALSLIESARNDESNASAPAWEISVVPGGRERHESVRFGIDALAEQVEVVLVHDAARPLAPTDLFDRVIDAVHSQGCSVIPALPVADTIKRVDASGVVHETVDRAPLVAVQTPQGFPREMLAAAHEDLRIQSSAADRGTKSTSSAPTDDAEVVQRAGGTVRTVLGDPLAHKLTTPGDLALLKALLEALEGDDS